MRIRLTYYAMRNLLEMDLVIPIRQGASRTGLGNIKLESLILAQNERWRRA